MRLLFIAYIIGTLSPGDSVEVSSEKATLREGPGNSFPIVKVLPESTAAIVISTDNNWTRLEVDGITGWVLANRLSITTPATMNKDAHLVDDPESMIDESYIIARLKKDSPVMGDNQQELVQLTKGNLVRILASKGDNINIVTPDGIAGWLSIQDLIFVADAYDQWQDSLTRPQLAIVSGKKLTLRSGAGKDKAIIGRAIQGDTLRIASKQGEWLELIDNEGASSWGRSIKVEIVTLESPGEEFIAKAPVLPESDYFIPISELIVYDTPNNNVTGNLTQTDTLRILESKPFWAKITTGTIEGWVNTFWLKEISPDPKKADKQKPSEIETSPITEDKKEDITLETKAKPIQQIDPSGKQNWVRVFSLTSSIVSAGAFVMAAVYHASGNDLYGKYESSRETAEAESLRVELRDSEKLRDSMIWIGIACAATAVGVWNAENMGIIGQNKQLAVIPKDDGIIITLRVNIW